jgi:uncharacterized membrane protein
MAIGSTPSLVAKVRSYVVTFPDDLAISIVALAVSGAVLVAKPGIAAVEFLFGLPLLLFLPGYGVVSALFPGTRERITRSPPSLSSDGDAGIDAVERVGLSLGLSVALVPLVAMALYAADVGLALDALVVGLVLVSGTGLVVGSIRRRRLPAEERFDPSLGAAVERGYGATVGAETRLEGGVNVVLAASILVAATAFGFALMAPQSTEAGSNLMILTERDGSYVAGGYPDLTSGESAQLTLGVRNEEGERVDYTVVVETHRVDGGEVVDAREVTRLSNPVAAGETWYATHDVSVAGDHERLTYLLYRGDAPADPDIDSAYRHAYLWTDGTGSDE